MNEKEAAVDPLVAALPPATDYITYLTLVEYQLTRERLPTLHAVLQDEKLTTNIGWDLVDLLLPLLPHSHDCLDDVARLGNPREVILRVSDALLKLQEAYESDDSCEDDDEDDENENKTVDLNGKQGKEVGDTGRGVTKLPLHIRQFSCLLSMLSVLHSRIKTKYPSRFIATSLQAVLEAYSDFPSAETTASILELLRDLSGCKRPRPPPRNLSEQAVTLSTGKEPAPDPEADNDGDPASADAAFTFKLLQFGLVETLKTYLLHCVDKPSPSGMHWAVRLLEKNDNKRHQISARGIPTCLEKFELEEPLRVRDATVGRIVALSWDLGLETQDLLNTIFNTEQFPPLNFDDLPSSSEDIHLEKHGCVLLIAARTATATLFGSKGSKKNRDRIHLFPDVVNVIFQFFGQCECPYLAAGEVPAPLTESILTLGCISETSSLTHGSDGLGAAIESVGLVDEAGFKTLVLGLTACVRAPPHLRAFSRLEAIPAKAFHSHANAHVRLGLIDEIFSDDDLRYARISALQWLKEELLAGLKPSDDGEPESLFSDPVVFSSLYSQIYRTFSPPVPCENSSRSSRSRDVKSRITSTSPTAPKPSSGANPTTEVTPALWMEFIQNLAPLYLAKLNFYYFLCKSSKLSNQLHLSKTTHPSFHSSFLHPLRKFISLILTNDSVMTSIEETLGSTSLDMGRGAASVVMQLIEDVEAALPPTASK